MQLKNNVYDILKWGVLIFLPAFSVFYTAIDETFGWGSSDAVCKAVSAVELFIGTCIGISTKEYKSNGSTSEGKADHYDISI